MQCLQYNVKFTLKAIRNSKSNIVNGRTNQQSKGGEVHLENNLRMSRSRMNLIRENSRHEIEEPISTRAPSKEKRRQKKTKPANNARHKKTEFLYYFERRTNRCTEKRTKPIEDTWQSLRKVGFLWPDK